MCVLSCLHKPPLPLTVSSFANCMLWKMYSKLCSFHLMMKQKGDQRQTIILKLASPKYVCSCCNSLQTVNMADVKLVTSSARSDLSQLMLNGIKKM